MDKHYQTVVQGEASESDEEEELNVNNNVTSSVVVDGEAEETDEEELDTSHFGPRKDIRSLQVGEYPMQFDGDEISSPTSLLERKPNKPKHDTILNRKLWESNLSLCTTLNGLACQSYLQAAKDINNCSQQVAKSHGLVQDVSHSMRLMTNDLFNLHDRIDIVTSCTILPTISIPAFPTAPVQGKS